MNRDLFAASGGGVVEATTDPYFKSTTLLLSGDGTNGAQNNTFIDSSTNNATITRSGTPTQGTFTPFSQTGWSGYFNGSSYLQTPSTAGFAMGTGDFTIELWYYPLSGTNSGLFQLSATSGGFYGSAANSLAMNLYLNNTLTVYAANTATATGTNKVPYNTWTHIALVRSSGVIKLYLNGVLETSIFTSGSLADTTNYTGTYGVIGGYYSTGYLSNAYISNFRVVKGTAVYTGNFTPPIAPLTATQAAGTNIAAITGTATSLLTLQDNRFKDNALTPNTITVAGTPSVQAFSPFAPTAAYSVPAAAAGSAYFNGTNNSLVIPASALWEFGSGAFTVECWVRPTAVGVLQYIAFHGWAGSGGLNYGWSIHINASNQLQFYVNGDSRAFTDIVMSVDTWTHLAVTGSAGVLSAYKNGVKSATTWSYSSFVAAASNTLVIGGYNNNNANAAERLFYKGYISNFRVVKGTAVYTGAFTPSGTPLSKIQSADTNIAALSGTETSLLTLQDSTFKDNATPPNPITASSPAPVIQSFTPFTQVWGGLFNGSSDYLLTTNVLSNAGNFTIECWVYPQAGASGRVICGAAGWELYLSGFTVNFVHHSVANFNSSLTLKQDSWSHVVVERYNFAAGTSGGYRIFVNGVMYDTGGSVAGGGTVLSTQSNLLVGGSYYVSTPRLWWAGYISNLRIVNNTVVYTGAFTPPTKTLSATQAAGVNISAITGTATSLLTLQDPTFKDNATTPNTITAAGTPKSQLLSAPFTGSAEGSAWNISVTAPLATVGGSMYLNGGTDYLQTPSTAGFAMGTGDFTIESWVYAVSGANNGILQISTTAGGFQTATNTSGFALSISTSNSILLSINAQNLTTSTNKLPFSAWTHLALVRNSGVVKLYINGVLETSIGTSGAIADTTNYTTTYMVIGGYYNTSYLFNGYISNLRITKGTAVYAGNFTPPTTPPQPNQPAGLLGSNVNAVDGTNTSLLLLGSNAGIYDATAKNDIITVGDTKVSSTQIKYGTGAMYFDGTGDYLTLPASTNWMFGTGDFTVEFWINTAGANSQILSLVGGTAAGNWQISIFNSSIYWQSARNTTDTYAVSSTAISNSAWHHVAYCRTSNALKVYFDGVAQGAGISDATNYNISSVLNVGYSSSYFTGYLDDLRITKYARYTTTFTPPTKAMIGQ